MSDKKQLKKAKKEMIEHLDDFLLFSSIAEYKKTLDATFFSYLLEQSTSITDANFKDVVENHYYLVGFLDKLEEYRKESFK